MLGCTRDDLLNTGMMDLTHADDRTRIRVLMDSLANGGSDYSVERRYVRRDGAVIWVADRVSGIREGNRVTSVVAVSFDLSQRKRLEAEVASIDAHLAIELEALARLEGLRALRMTRTNRQAVLDELLNAAIAINQADKGMLQLCDPAKQRLVVVAQRGLDDTYVSFCNEATRNSGSGSDGESAEQSIVEDVGENSGTLGTPERNAMLRAGVRAVQSAPLKNGRGETAGHLTTYFRTPHRPDARTARVFDLVAREVAGIIERGMAADVVASGRRDA
jgi:PAS domain S-box-containing protein